MRKRSNDIGSVVMDKIKSGELRMKPKAYYTLLAAVSTAAIVLAGMLTAYLLSIVFFWLRIQTAETMAYGARANLRETVSTFPWWAIGLTILLLAGTVVLVRRHGTLYRHRVSTVALVIVTCSLLLGLMLSLLGIGKTHTPNQPGARGQNASQQRGN